MISNFRSSVGHLNGSKRMEHTELTIHLLEDHRTWKKFSKSCKIERHLTKIQDCTIRKLKLHSYIL